MTKPTTYKRAPNLSLLTAIVAAWVGNLTAIGCDSGATDTGGTSSDPGTGEAVTTTTPTTGDPSGGSTGESTATTTIDDDTTGGGMAGMCNVWTQDCPEGQKCMPYSGDGDLAWESLKCTPVVEDPKQAGDVCSPIESSVSGFDNCDKGLMCYGAWLNPKNEGVCLSMCTGSADAPECEDPNKVCVIGNDGVVNLCRVECDPLLENCLPGELCTPTGLDAQSTWTCGAKSEGEFSVFSPCSYSNACDPGMLCWDPSFASECDQTAGCCLPLCDLSEVDTMCPGMGQECLPFYPEGMAPPGYENVGLCGVPK